MLAEYVSKHAVRGACTCGSCIDAPPNPEQCQPSGHTADLVFFRVAKKGFPDPSTFRDLVQEEFPRWLDGKEHNYITMGAEIGDQGIALMTMGLGHLLGVWTLLTPLDFGISEKQHAVELASLGMVAIMA